MRKILIPFCAVIITFALMNSGYSDDDLVIAGDYLDVEPGIVQPYSSTVVPDGYLLCDGRAVSRTTYADLFKVIGITYGSGDGDTTFNLPNYAGRILVGMDSSDSAVSSVGLKGGQKELSLTVANLPSHSHTVAPHYHSLAAHTHGIPALTGTTSTDGAHEHKMNTGTSVNTSATTPVRAGSGGAIISNASAYDTGEHTHTVTIPSGKQTGAPSSNISGASKALISGEAGASSPKKIDNMQEYTVTSYIIKY